jgi:endoribonuclease Dicer
MKQINLDESLPKAKPKEDLGRDNYIETESNSSDTESTEHVPEPESELPQTGKLANKNAFFEYLQAEQDSDPTNLEIDRELSSDFIDTSKGIIDDPRDYQVELFERAKTENIIAVLDTGSGKTLIAALLMRHIAYEEIQHRADGGTPRISFFLVNSVHLVRQQQKMLAHNLPNVPEALHGGVSDHLWEKAEWDKIKATSKAVVCTAEVLNQCLMHSFINMTEINLIVFDEAHHSKKGHPYARVIKDYYLAQEDPSLRPRIFGMTASPVDGNKNMEKAAR